MEVTPDEAIAKLHCVMAPTTSGMSDDPQNDDCQPIVTDIPPPALWAPVRLHLQIGIGGGGGMPERGDTICQQQIHPACPHVRNVANT